MGMAFLPSIADLATISSDNSDYSSALGPDVSGIVDSLPTSLNPANLINSVLSNGVGNPLQQLTAVSFPNLGNSVGSQLQNMLGQVGSVQSVNQLASAVQSITATNPNLNGSNPISGTSAGNPNTVDRRIRIRAVTGQEQQTYGDQSGLMGIMWPNGGAGAAGSNGLVFPFTPSVTWNSGADYANIQPTHSNQEYFVFNRAPSVQLTIAGTFTSQNQREAQYSLAVMHFCRAMRYMNFGANDVNRGMPPRILLLSGYGGYIFNDLPIIFKDYSTSFDKDVDFVEYTDITGTTAWVPVYWNLSINVIVQNTPNRWLNTFNLDQFKSGFLLRQTPGGWF